MDIFDRRQLKILKSTVKNPMEYLLNPIGLDQAKAIEILKTKFKYTDKQINKLKEELWNIQTFIN